jgi:hypothetical protein
MFFSFIQRVTAAPLLEGPSHKSFPLSGQISDELMVKYYSLKRGHISNKATVSMQKGWPYMRGITVLILYKHVFLVNFKYI